MNDRAITADVIEPPPDVQRISGAREGHDPRLVRGALVMNPKRDKTSDRVDDDQFLAEQVLAAGSHVAVQTRDPLRPISTSRSPTEKYETQTNAPANLIRTRIQAIERAGEPGLHYGPRESESLTVEDA